jgi:hypothetical protein
MSKKAYQYLTKVKIAVKIENKEELVRFNTALNLDVSVPREFPIYVSLYEHKANEKPKVVTRLRELVGFGLTSVESIKSTEAIERVWQQHVNNAPNDLNKIQFKFAVFCSMDNRIYKLAAIDYRSNRFDVSGERMTRWIDFDYGVMFDFTNEEEFMHYYNIHITTTTRPQTVDEMQEWLKAKSSRLSFIKPDVTEEKPKTGRL